MYGSGLLGPIEAEFEGAELGDPRLNERLGRLVSLLDQAPDQSLSQASKTVAAREAAYRFVRNRRVTLDALLAPHARATAQRCREAGQVYVVSDTTECSFGGSKRGESLGRLQGKRRGFLAHVALAVSADGHRTPLGVLGATTLVREEDKAPSESHARKKNPRRESLRWGAMVEQVEEELDGVSAIHVMDREADIYELLSDLRSASCRFVIRAGQNRWAQSELLFDALTEQPSLLEREIQLSARPHPRKTTKGRGHPARPSRSAKLTVCSKTVRLRRPKTTGARYPQTIEINVVRVYEPEPPTEQEPVEWWLLTSEPIATAQDVARVVDIYRARWVIEEYFKALKTGCAFEGRQLRSIHTLSNALGLLCVIAWRLLLLRSMHRNAPDSSAHDVLDPLLLEALAARLRHIREPKVLPTRATVADVMMGIARLGGHHASNGPPGWQLLWAGFQDLLLWAAGYFAGKQAATCDPS
jgi:hypothetical protein